MAAIHTDDEEELLILRIEALRSTPRVNTSFEYSSADSDDTETDSQNRSFHNETNHDHERKGKQLDDAGDEVSNNDTADDEDEVKLRQVALKSLSKSTSTCPISTAAESNNSSTNAYIPVNQNEVKDTTQELLAIQHDLVSSTSGEIAQKFSIEELENSLQSCNQSLCIANLTGVADHQSILLNTSLSCSLPINSTNTKLSRIESLDNTIDFEISKLPHNTDSETIYECEDEEVMNENIEIVTSKSSPMISEVEVKPASVSNEKIKSQEGCSYQDEVPILKSNEVESCDGHSPSVAVACVNNDSHHNEAYTPSCNDDVLSLCTSDKEENELNDHIDKEIKCTVNLCDIRYSEVYLNYIENKNINLSPTYDNQCISEKKKNDKNDDSASTASSCGTTETETSKLKFNGTTNNTLDKTIPSAEGGLGTVLDRYIDEVAATKKKLNENLHLYSDTEVEIFLSPEDENLYKCSSEKDNNDKEWVECEPGPSGYVPTIVNDYFSDSDESITDNAPVEDGKIVNQHLLSTCTLEECKCSLIGKKEMYQSNDENFKISLDEQNIQEDGKREDLKDVNCPICLGPFENRSFLHACFHSFCYMCIIQWSELSHLCPLCKTKFVSMIHSVNTDLDYLTYEFPDDLPEKKTSQQPREFSETMDDGRRFRYRSTMVDHESWAARRTEREQSENTVSHEARNSKKKLHWSTTKDRRKSVYAKGLNVKEVKQRGKPKFRDITPKFFEENPALKHRLVPWLLRDLSVLIGNVDDDIRFVMSLILNLVSKVSMGGDEFKDQLRPFLFHQTDHFVTELISFASSPYDIRGYDEHVKYSKPNVVEITSSPVSVNAPSSINDAEINDAEINDAEINDAEINDAEPAVFPTVEIPSDESMYTVTISENDDVIKLNIDEADKIQLSNISNDDTSSKEEKGPKKEGKKKKKKKHKRKGKSDKSDKMNHKKKKDLETTKQNEEKVGDKNTDLDEKIGGKNTDLNENKEGRVNKETVKDANTIVNLLPTSDLEKNGHKKLSNLKKRRSSEKKKKHKHKHKHKHGKHKKRKRKISSSSDDSTSKYEPTTKKVTNKKSIDIKHDKGKSESEQKKCPVNLTDDKKVKKSLKRKGITLGSPRLLKRKKKENDQNNVDIIENHKKKVKKKKSKHKHKKEHRKKTHRVSILSHKKSPLKNKEIRCKIDHAINKITKGITSSDDEDDLLNLEEIQDLLSRYKLNDNIDLIKDGDGYKTRAEVVHELLLIEKAITRRQDKKQKQIELNQTSNSKLVVGNNNPVSSNETLCEKPNNELIKVRKKVEREKPYQVLIKELQEIEGHINSCRSSLQSKPADMMEANV